MCSQRILDYLAFQSFDYDGIWYREVQARVVCTKFEIYAFIIHLFYDPTCSRPEYVWTILPLEASPPIIHQSFQKKNKNNEMLYV
jgi:hypothetical protein